MADMILRNARIAGQDALSDIGISGGRIVAAAEAADGAEVARPRRAGWSRPRWSSRTSTSTRC